MKIKLLWLLGMMLVGGWMLEQLSNFMVELWSDFGLYLR